MSVFRINEQHDVSKKGLKIKRKGNQNALIEEEEYCGIKKTKRANNDPSNTT